MPLAKRLTMETVNLDDEQERRAFQEQIIDAGMERVRAHRAALRAQGLLSVDGKLLVTELPDDMQPGAERDFGG